MEIRRPGERKRRQFQALVLVASYLSTRFAVLEGIGKEQEGRECFSTSLKHSITLKIIARHRRSMVAT